MKSCDYCGGLGGLEVVIRGRTPPWGDGADDGYWKECQHCNGTGWIEGDPPQLELDEVIPMKTPKMRHCFYCGQELGVYADHDPLDTCGARECEREARNAALQERQEAHEQLDRDMGWL